MLSSLAAAFGETLDQKIIDLFNLKNLGPSPRGPSLYIAEGDLQIETQLLALKKDLSEAPQTRSWGAKLFAKDPLKVAESCLSQHKKDYGYDLNSSQQSAIRHLLVPKRLSILQGKAGTGKTTVLRTVAEAYAKAGYRVLGTSFQGAAVGELASSIGKPLSGAYTLDKLTKLWRTNKMDLDAKTILIVDEAGMAPSRLMILKWTPWSRPKSDIF